MNALLTTKQRMDRASSRLAVAVGVVIATVLLPVSAASAHVTAQPGTAEAGGYAVVTFRVPNESDTASTTKVTVTLPGDHPFTSVRTTVVAGWTPSITMRTLDEPIESHGREITEVASEVTWTADRDAGVAPGTFRDFPLSLGAMPEDVDVLYFPTTQTYSDGEVVGWDQEPTGETEPERPAPAVQLTGSDDTATASHHGSAPAAAIAAENAATKDQTDPLARWLGGGALGLGGIAIGLALGSARKRRAA